MSSPCSVSVLGVPAGSDKEEVEVRLQQAVGDVRITRINVRERDTIVAFNSISDAKKFREILPLDVGIGLRAERISLNHGAESVPTEHKDVINGNEVCVAPKVAPGNCSNKLLLKATTDIRQRYLKLDLEKLLRLESKDIDLKEIAKRVFIATFAKESDVQPLIEKLKGGVPGVDEISPFMTTDCLMIKTENSLPDYLLDTLFSRMGENSKVTKKHRVAKNCVLVHFSNSEDTERTLEKFYKNPLVFDSQKLHITPYWPHLGKDHVLSKSLVDLRQKSKSDIPLIEGDTKDRIQVKDLKKSDHGIEKSSKTVEIAGLESNCNPAKLKIFLQNLLKVAIDKIDGRNENAVLSFNSTEDAEDFRRNFPEYLNYSFGLKTYQLKLASGSTDASSRGIETEAPVRPSSGSSFDSVHTWYSRPPDFDDCNKMGILITDICGDLHPDKIVDYYRELSKSRGSYVKNMIPMVDGIFITFQDPQVTDFALKSSPCEIDGSEFCVFPKRIPEYFSDQLLMKNTPQSINEEVQLLSLENCSTDRIKPTSVQKLGGDASRIQYKDKMGLEKLVDIKKRTEKDPDTKKMQISLLPKTDCLKIRMLKGDNLEEAKPIMENVGITGGGKVTRFDRISSDTALLYFTDYKDVEAMSGKFLEKHVIFGGSDFAIELYYHCFSNDHNILRQPNNVDIYFRKYMDGAQKDIHFRVDDKSVWKFLLLKKKHLRTLQISLEKIATVNLDERDAYFVFSPLLVRENDESWNESSIRDKVKNFLLEFSSRDCEVDKQKLAEVRRMQKHPKIANDYDGSDNENISVRWTDNAARVVGVNSEVASFIDLVTQLADVTSNSLKIHLAAKYRWFLECKMFHEVAEKYRAVVEAAADDVKCQIQFSGQNEHIALMKCEILSQLETVFEKIIIWNDIRTTFLLNAKGAPIRVSKIFQDNNLKAILHVKDKVVSIWACEMDHQKAKDALEECLKSDATIQLKSQAHRDVTTLKEWVERVRNLHDSQRLAVEIENEVVAVAGFRSDVDDAVPILKNILDSNLKHCEVFQLKYIEAHHIQHFLRENLDKLKLTWYLDHEKRGIALIGKIDVIKEATQLLENLAMSIETKDHQIDRYAIGEYFLAKKKEIVLSVSSSSRCTILVEDFDWRSTSSSSRTALMDTPFQLLLDFLTISIVQSNIPWDDSDAVVCVNDMSTPGHGSELTGGIRVTTVAEDANKKLLHISLSDGAKPIHNHVLNVLTGAEKLKCKSISIPVLKEGNLNHTDAAKEMMKGVLDFTKRTGKAQFLKHIKILVHNSVKYKDFTEAFSTYESGHRTISSRTSSSEYESENSDESSSSEAEDTRSEQQKSSVDSQRQSVHSLTSGSSSFGTLKVSVRRGDITMDTNDIIVNSIGSSFELAKGGAVSKIIADKGGTDIQKQLSSSTTKDLRVTSGGTLPCRKIIHVDAPQDANKLESCIIGVLRKANELQHASLSIPAVGTGGLGIKCDLAAQAVRKALMNFSTNDHQPKHLKSVDLVIFDNAMVPVYEAALSLTQAGPLQQSKAQSPTRFSKIPFKVTVKQGNITEEKNEMIVNSLGDDFDLSSAGAVSKEILRKGGKDIQKELTSIKGSQIRITTAGGNLPCKRILHVATPRDITKLEDLTVSILREAENQQIKSLSIPAIGTGGLQFSSSQAAESLFAGLKKFSSKHSPRYLQVIDFVIFEQRMMSDFQQQLSRFQQGMSTSPAPISNSPTASLPASSYSSKQLYSLNVSVRQGDITLETNDMIVNGLGSDFMLEKAGVVSKTILRKGGARIQSELTTASGTEMRVTSGGNLSCKKILHLATPKDMGQLRRAVSNLLVEADKQECKSISIPAVGTGGLGLKSVDVATALFGGISKFAADVQPTSLKTIDIVVYESKMLQDFKDQFDQTQGVTSKPATKSTKQTIKEFIQKKKTTKRTTKQKREKQKGEKTLVLNSIKLTLHEGNIAEQECDVIVHNTTKSFDLYAGGFPRDIYGSREDEIKTEMSSSNDKLLRVTSSGVTSYKKIIHVAFPRICQRVKSTILRVFNEVVKMGCNSVVLLPLEGKKKIKSILEAATDFDNANSTTGCHLVVNLIGNTKQVYRRLHHVIIKKGRHLPGATIQGRPTRHVIKLQLCCLRDDGSNEEAIRQIESKVANSYHKESITCNDIKTVKQRQWSEIVNIGATHKVKICHSKEGNEDVIGIEGIKEEVFQAKIRIQDILSKIAEAEKVMKLGNYYWQYEHLDGRRWITFQPVDNQVLEELFQGKKNDGKSDESLPMYVDDDKREFEVDVKKGVLSGYRTVKIERREIEDFPAVWCNMGAETIMRVQLKQSDSDYKTVNDKFITTMDKPSTILSSHVDELCEIRRLQNAECRIFKFDFRVNTLVKKSWGVLDTRSVRNGKGLLSKGGQTKFFYKITRIQNKTLYEVFETKRKAVKKYCRTEPLTRQLFHGTKSEVVEEICNVGFDRIYSGTRVGAVLGCGNYFAVNASYSAKGYAAADGNGVCTMILAEVITGDFVKGHHTYKCCPKKDWAKHIPYESLVDDIKRPSMFVAFHDAGAYPAYVIKFKL